MKKAFLKAEAIPLRNQAPSITGIDGPDNLIHYDLEQVRPLIVSDYTIVALMGLAAVIAAASFSVIAKYLFDRGLADRNGKAPDIRIFYKTYMTHTRKKTGRIGVAFWVHSVSAGIFIFTGVVYTIFRLILPRFIEFFP